MKKLLRALKQWTLLIAIVVGAVGHSFFSQFTWLAPWLLASMLLLTFCNISPRDLRFHPLHLILMSLQIVMSLGLYALTLPWHPAIAQGVCMAALTPTATAASSTVALETSNSMIRFSRPHCLKYSRTRSIAICDLSLLCDSVWLKFRFL